MKKLILFLSVLTASVCHGAFRSDYITATSSSTIGTGGLSLRGKLDISNPNGGFTGLYFDPSSFFGSFVFTSGGSDFAQWQGIDSGTSNNLFSLDLATTTGGLLKRRLTFWGNRKGIDFNDYLGNTRFNVYESSARVVGTLFATNGVNAATYTITGLTSQSLLGTDSNGNIIASAGSTQHIQNTLTPTTTTQQFSVQIGSVTQILQMAPGATIQFSSNAAAYKMTLVGTNLRIYGGQNGGGDINITEAGWLVPTSGSQDLGSDAMPWRTLKASGWTAGNGSVQFPSINFQNNTSMGFLSLANETVSLSLANAHAVQWINPGGAPSANRIHYYSRSSTQDRGVAVEAFGWSDGTDATRKGRYTLSVVDTSTRPAVQIDTDGTSAYTTFRGSATFNGDVVLSSITYVALRTLAQIKAYTPASVGGAFYCSDCTTDGLCVSTGTAQGAFGRSSSKNTACQ